MVVTHPGHSARGQLAKRSFHGDDAGGENLARRITEHRHHPSGNQLHSGLIVSAPWGHFSMFDSTALTFLSTCLGWYMLPSVSMVSIIFVLFCTVMFILAWSVILVSWL